MDIITGLQNKNNEEAYQLLLQLERQATESNALYQHFDDFVGLLNNKSSYVRTRGFRLACSQARWDIDDRIDENLDVMLCMLDDKKPIAVRQCLEALHIVVIYKPDSIADKINAKLESMDLSKYSDSMIPLIENDIEELRKSML